MSTYLIKAGQLIDGRGGDPVNDVGLLVVDGRIAEIRDSARLSSSDSEMRVLDYSDSVLIPGLIDAHVHLIFNADATHEQVIDYVERSDSRELLARAIFNSQRALASGVTTLRDCGDRDYVTLSLRDYIDRGLIVGPRLAVCGPPLTTTGGHLHFCHAECDTVDELRKWTRDLAKKDVDHIKIMATGGNMTPSSNNRLSQYTEEELRLVVQEAHQLGKPVTAHTLAAEGIRRAVNAGVDDLEHCNWLADDSERDLEYLSDTVSDMVSRGVYWGNTLSGIFRSLLTEDTAPTPREKLLEWCGLFRRMFDSGVKMMISSDAGVRFTRFDDFASSLEVAVRYMGITELETITAATKIPAEAIGWADEIGTIEQGKLADLVVLQKSPLEDIGNLRSVRQVIKGGVPLTAPF